MGKKDYTAMQHWGEEIYQAIPKSVFALACWHLADACSDSGVGNGESEKRFIEEIECLRDNGIIDKAQAKRAIAALIREV